MTDRLDMIVPLLREMRSENAALHRQTLERLIAIEQRLQTIEATQLSFRLPLAADSLLGRLGLESPK